MPCERFTLPDGSFGMICFSRPRRSKGESNKVTKPAKLEWPATRKQLYAAGYSRELTRAARPCKRCGRTIEFWKTPEGKLMPLEESAANKDELLCHFATCPHAAEFRKPEHEPRTAKPPSTQKELFG